MKLRVLSVLMWKHVVVRIRRFVHTAVDYVSPLMFFILLFAFKDKMRPPRTGTEYRDPVANTDIIPLVSDIIPPPYCILYYPETILTNALMDDVGAKLNLKRLNSTGGHSERGYAPLSNLSLVPELATKMKIMEAIIIFQEMTGETWPTHLNYTIRMKTDFKTGTYQSLDDSPGPHRMYGFKYGTFMRIQWAVDTSYIKLLTGNEVSQTLSIQEFPYYYNRMDEVTMIICKSLMVLCWLSLLLTFVFLMGRLLQERASGIQELMKMVGVSPNLLALSHFLNVLPIALIFSIGGTILLKATSNPLIPFSSGILIFLMLLLYFNTIVSFAFACSYISSGTSYAASLSVLAYVFLWIPARLVSGYNKLPYIATLASGFLPHTPMYWFWLEVSTVETFGIGASFSNMATTHAYNNGSVLLSLIFLLLQSVIGYFLTWYLSHVRPGQYGQALPWNFLCKGKPKRNQKKSFDSEQSEDYEMSQHGSSVRSSVRAVTYELKRVTRGIGRLREYPTRFYSREADDWKPKRNQKKSFDNEQSEDYEMSEHSSSVRSTVRAVTYELRRVTRGIGRLREYPTRFFSREADDPSYWNKNEVKPESEGEEEEPITVDQRFFEPAPADAETGIKVVNVSKVYPKNRALRNVSLEVYKGEITVLLGHNGAGKTTLMSIITGMTSATEGKVYVNGKDTVTQQEEVRKHLGLCPQHNLFFEDLTVQEHIMFFTLLKQSSFSEARTSARELAERLTLTSKLNSLPNQLSGGMKRRVQLACALTGGADVLVLDEPTSGLDVETRRELWDLLLSLRGERTVLLTTHFMEEADALGDRVAALHVGVLRCFATTMHLKKAVGSGYRLALTTIGTPKEQAITKVVTKQVPDATLKEQTINSILYSLPATQSRKFPKLFAALEAKRSELGIDSIGVGVSTLEEVFLKLCSDIDTTLSEDEVDHAGEPELPPKNLTGAPLYLRQYYVLLKRQVRYAIHKKWVFLILQIILPIIMITFMTYTLNHMEEDEPPTSVSMNLDLYGDRGGRRVMYHVSGPAGLSQDIDTVRKRYPKVAFEDTDDVATAVLRTGQKDILEYNKYLVGLEINETDAKILYSTMVRHAAPVALNLLSNVLAAQHMPWADGRTLSTLNDPLGRELQPAQRTAGAQPKDQITAVMWGIFIVVIILSTNINCVSLPCKERQTNSRHIHVMSGCPAELHWLATLSFHAALCALSLVLPTVLAVLLWEQDDTTNQPDMLATFALIMMLGSLSFFAFSYLVSFNFGERGTSTILVACIFVFAIFTPFTKEAQEFSQNEASGLVYYLLSVFSYIAPPHTTVEAVLQCLSVGRLNAMCKFVRPKCPRIFYNEPGFDVAKCCAGENPRCYLCLDDFSPGKSIIILFVQFLVLMTMVFLTERGIFNGVVDKLMNLRYQPKEPVEQDTMVRAESAYVSKAITLPTKQIPDAMLVHDLHKNYRPFCKKSVNAVRGVSFSVKKGECFGLLGVNGAGKSSTFKMLTAEESATRGNIFGNGYHLKRGNSQYLQTLGYCPQFFGLDMFLTGQENLALILTLRGFDKERVDEEVRNWIHIVGLEKYARRRVEGYSGGCVRRLGAAAALCGGAELALLDEPSAGVDVAARRRLWTALRKALRQQRAIIITSHSMDEMEALCSRIAIMSGGRVVALGTAAGLRAQHARGHAVVLKLTSKLQAGADEVDGAKTQMNELKGKLQSTFNCTLKDEHKTMLHYHINETMRYSDLFTALESLREAFPSLIEDYSVTETTLEEVFLSFAKEQQNEPQSV